MKKILLLLLCLTYGLSAGAQEKKKFFDATISNRPITFGIRGGLNFNGLGPDIARIWDENFKTRTDSGWNIGLVVDCPILNSLYFQPGVFFKTKGFQIAESDEDFTRQIRGKANYIQFPLLFSYRYNIRKNLQVQFDLGPYIGVGLSGTVRDYTYTQPGPMPKGFSAFSDDPDPDPDPDDPEDPEVTEREYFGDNLETSFGIKRSDIGICIGVGMTVNRFYFGFQYDLGVSNLCNELCWGSKTRFYNHSATILIGFNINKN